MGKFIKGQSGNPRGRPPGKGPGPIVMYDLKQAMRALCPEAAKVVKRCLKSDDEKIALLAAQIAFDRGFGKPEVSAEVEVSHKFVVAPNTLPIDEWLATKGQGWLGHQKEQQAQHAKSEAPTTIDLKANEERPEPELPPTPLVDPSKLN